MSQNRQLAAIMFTDIAGYTALMQTDEKKGVEIRKRHRKIFNATTKQFRGNILQYYGDGTLSIFDSVVDAVKCGFEMQLQFQIEPAVPVRIGVHLGDIIVSDDEVIGDAVNVASRIESMAVVGSVLVSDRVQLDLNNHEDIDTQSLGVYELKNVERPVEVFAVSNMGLAIPKAYQISEKAKPLRPGVEPNMSNHTHSRDAGKSIAILPFVNMSNDPDQEYFCDGLTEEILNMLAQLDKLKVAARSSSFSYKNRNEKIHQIGKELNVAHVLEGSVRKAGSRLRITAQLIKVSDGFHIWSERYDREISDIFDIQDEIAFAILDNLKIRLLGEEKAKVLKHGTDDPEAFQLYLKGLLNFRKFTPESLQKAIEFYNEAIEINPTYAKAYAGMVSCYHILWIFSFLPTDQSAPFMQKAALKSIELDDQLAESHLALGRVKFWYEYDLVEAERRFERSLQIDPNNPDTLGQYGLMLSMSGDRAKALALGAKAVELDPFSPLTNLDYTWIQLMCGEYDGMREQALRMIEIHPNFYSSTSCLGHYYWSQSDYDRAIELLELSVKQNYSQLTVSTLGCIYAVAGKEKEAHKILSDLNEMKKKTPVPAFCFAKIYAGLNEMELAFDYLEKAAVDRADYLVFLDGLRRANLIPTLTENAQLLEYIKRVGIPHHVDSEEFNKLRL